MIFLYVNDADLICVGDTMKIREQAIEFIEMYGWAILFVLSIIGAMAYFGVFDNIIPDPDRDMEEAFDDMGDYYEVCKKLGHETSAQFNDKIYCKKEVDGVIMLYPIDEVEDG